METKVPGVMVGDTDYKTEVANNALRIAPEMDQEYWLRQSRAALHRDALEAEGKTAPIPSAFNQGSTINGGTYVGWFPGHDCGTAANDAVSGDCGNAIAETIWLNGGSA